MKFRSVIAIAVVSVLSLPVMAGEGMWMPDQVQLFSEQLGVLGLELDAASFADLTGFPMGAVIQIPGCTASFVSPKGLVVTNHHCAYGSIQHNSTPENDLITNGFLARSMSEELEAAPGTRVWVTTRIGDVTDEILGKLDGLSDAKRYAAIEARTKKLIGTCEKPGGVRCDVASFDQGARFMMITAMEIRDVRLVYAPAEGIGNYGDEIDNFMWPRHVGDFSFYRAYVGPDGKPADYSPDNVPYEPKHHLQVSTTGVNEGDLVIVAGYPGRTRRYLTASEFAYYYDFSYPRSVDYFQAFVDMMIARGKEDAEARILLANRLAGYANALKNYQGTLDGMKRGEMMAVKKKQTDDLAAFIASTPDRQKKYGGVIEKIDELEARSRETMERDLVMRWLERSSTLLSQATTIYRLADEHQKKDADRKPGYQNRDFERTKARVTRAQRQFDPVFDRQAFRYFLLEATKLPADQRIEPIDEMLEKTGESTPEAQVEALLDRLYANTKMDSVDERLRMLEEKPKKLAARKDAFLELAAALDPLVIEAERREEEIEGAMTRVRPLYLQALRDMKEGVMYPDANSTLRVTLGTVEGYSPRDGVTNVPQTTVAGIVAKHTGIAPFDATEEQLEVIRAKKFEGYIDPELGAVPVNFLSNVDTTGGNSGSPTLNRKGELCGLLFDGVWESIAAGFVFTPEVVRSIHTDATYMLWVMDYVDGAHNLLEEMGVPAHNK